MGIPGFSRAWFNPAHRGSFTSALSRGSCSLQGAAGKAIAAPHFCVYAGYSQNYHLTISVFIPPSLLPRLITPEEFLPLVALERQSYTSCVPGLWEGWAEESQRQNHVQQNCFLHVFSFFLNIDTLSYFLVCVPSADFVDIPSTPGPG